MSGNNGHGNGIAHSPAAPTGTEAFALWASTLALYRANLLAAGIPAEDVLTLTTALQTQIFSSVWAAAPTDAATTA